MMLTRPGADPAAHPRLSSGANRGVASQQAAALARPPEQVMHQERSERHVRADRASPLDELQARRAARPTRVSLLHRRKGSSAARAIEFHATRARRRSSPVPAARSSFRARKRASPSSGVRRSPRTTRRSRSRRPDDARSCRGMRSCDLPRPGLPRLVRSGRLLQPARTLAPRPERARSGPGLGRSHRA